MSYFLTKETLNKAIANLFSIDKNDSEMLGKINNDLNNLGLLSIEDDIIVEKIKGSILSNEKLLQLTDMLFQLKDYKFYLSYILQMLLKSEQFDCITNFISRTFVNHIGNAYYHSDSGDYDFKERYFDRFIEAIKHCEIDTFKIIPFLFYIYFSNAQQASYVFLRPAKEFLRKFIQENEASFLRYINNEKYYKLGYIIYLNLFKNRAASHIIENLIGDNYFNIDDMREIFNQNKEVGLYELKNYIIYQTGEKQKIALDFYLTFSSDITKSLPELYEQVNDENLKLIIKDEIELSKSIKFESIKDFTDYVNLSTDLEVEEGLSDKYAVYFKNGNKLTDKALTYIFNIFKNISSPAIINKYTYYKEFLAQNELDVLSAKLFNTMQNQFTWDNKWVVGFICSLGSEDYVNKIVSLASSQCVTNTELSSFVLGCLVEANTTSVVNLIKQLYFETNNRKFYYAFLVILAKNNGISALDYLDEMVSNYDLSEDATKQIVCNGERLLFEITENLTVKVKSLDTQTYINLRDSGFSDTEEALKYFNNLCHEIRLQIEKFKKSYKETRVWKYQVFKANILSNPLLKKIASTLMWGVYNSDNLISVVANIDDFENYANSESEISLIHPVELLDSFKYKNKFEPFNQINKQVFMANNKNFSADLSDEFNGVMVRESEFTTKIRALKYKYSMGSDNYFYKIISDANYFVKIEVMRYQKNFLTIGNIKFYNLNLIKTVNNKYVLTSVPSEKIGNTDKRIYSDILNEIYLAIY